MEKVQIPQLAETEKDLEEFNTHYKEMLEVRGPLLLMVWWESKLFTYGISGARTYCGGMCGVRVGGGVAL